MKKRVGIILDSLHVSKQIYDFIKLSSKAENYQITTLIVNDDKNKTNNFVLKTIYYIKKRGISKFFSTLLFKSICKLEQIILKSTAKFSSFYDKYELNKESFEIIHIKPIISKNGLVYRYDKSSISLISNSNLDLLIRSGSGILKGDILNACPNGIISFHHGDNNWNRGGPPGFWEVYQRNPRTGFIIQRLKEELDGGDVLFKGFISTSFFYSLNLAKLYEVSNPFLAYVIEDITSNNSNLCVDKKSPYCFPLFKTPSAYQSINYLLKTIWLIILKISRKLSKRSYRWGIAYQFLDNWKEVTLWRSKKIPNPKNRYLADPFLIKRNGVHFCFVEDYDYLTKKGSISVYKITQTSHKELGIVLSEDFHLSFPFLFEYENELYMCPETHEKREIRIYKCLEFPLKWVYYKTLMKNVSAVDTIIFEKNNRWWLLTNIDESFLQEHNYQLNIFHSSSPLSGNWTPHNSNPVILDSLFARNGGLIKENNQIYRVFQSQGFDLYGKSLGLSKINLINPYEYKEDILFKVQPKFFSNIIGTHTYNFNDGLLVIDYLEIKKINN